MNKIIVPSRRRFLETIGSATMGLLTNSCGKRIFAPSESLNSITRKSIHALFFGKGQYASDACDTSSCFESQEQNPIWRPMPFGINSIVEVTDNVDALIYDGIQDSVDQIRDMTFGKVDAKVKRTSNYEQANPSKCGVKIIQYEAGIPTHPGGGIVSRFDKDFIQGSYVMFDNGVFGNLKPNVLLGGLAHELGHGMLGWHHFNCSYFSIAGMSVMNSGKSCFLDSGPAGFTPLDVKCAKEVYRSPIKHGASEKDFEMFDLI